MSVCYLQSVTSFPHPFCLPSSAAYSIFVLFALSSAMTVPSERLQQLTVLKYLAGLTTAENVAVTRGYALALGCLPQRLAALPVGRLDEVFTALALAARPEATVAGEADVETRRAAVDAVVELAERFAFVLTDDQWDRSVEMLYVACEDYKTDKRGDTGSWCRSAALRGLERLHRARRRVRSDALGSGAGTTVLTSYGPARALQAVVTASDSDASVSHSYDICLSACGRGMLVQYPVGSLGNVTYYAKQTLRARSRKTAEQKYQRMAQTARKSAGLFDFFGDLRLVFFFPDFSVFFLRIKKNFAVFLERALTLPYPLT